MSVAKAEAALALAKAEAAFLEAKLAYQTNPKKKAAYQKATEVLVAARDEWRKNWRHLDLVEHGGWIANPDAVSASLKVN